MATEVRFRRGTTAQHAAFIGAPAEITVDTDKNTVVVHDGVTAGGFPLASDSTALKFTDTLATLRDTPLSYERVYVNAHSTEGDGGHGVFRAVTGAAAGTYVDNNGTIIVPTGGDGSSAWLREYSGAVNVKWFGAKGDGITNDTLAIQDAISALSDNQKALLPEGVFLATAATSLDTEKVCGDGVLKNSNGVIMYARQRKNYNDYSELITLEDEYKDHDYDGTIPLNYTSFGSSIVHHGAEYIAARCGYTHTSDFTKVSKLVVYKVCPKSVPSVTRAVLYTSPASADIRDVNITLLRSTVSYALISFAEALSTGGYQTRLITVNLDSFSVVKNQVVSGVPSTYFKWGNIIANPNGNILFCTYQATGNKIQIWKSTIPFTGTEDITATLVTEIGETSDCFEPTIAQWKDKYIIIYRKNNDYSKFTYSYDLTNAAEWAPTRYTGSRKIFAPACLAYSDNDVFTVVGVNGYNRTNIVTASTSSVELGVWETSSYLRVAGELATGGSNGYPSISDLGGQYAITTFSDIVATAAPPTRFERTLIEKKLIDVSLNSPARRFVIAKNDSSVTGITSGVVIGNVYMNGNKDASNGINYSTICYFKEPLNISSVILMLSGSSTTAKIEVYADNVLLATSNTINVSATYASAVEFTFASAFSVERVKEYKFKLKSDTALAIYGYRHNKGIASMVDFNKFTVHNSFNNADYSISNTSLIVPAFKYNV